MKKLEEDLNELILKIKPLPPMGWSTPFQDVVYPYRGTPLPAAVASTVVEPLLPLE